MVARRWIALAGLALITLAAPTIAKEEAEPKHLALGNKAPMSDIEMVGVDGKKITIAKAAGKKGTLVIFTCNSCPWVKAWEERTVELGNGFAKQGVGVIAINSNDSNLKEEDNLEGMKARVKARGVKYAYVVDQTSEVARAFGATRTPEVFLFDAKGALVYHGAIDDNAQKEDQVKERYLENALEAVVAGKKVKVQETKALGCTIKFRKEA